MLETAQLLLGTLLLRPYVFVFLAVYVAACAARFGIRTTLVFMVLGYGIAFCSEFASIHVGFPYGHYYYIPATAGRELWVAGVPFMDSLSYVFLSFASFAMALLLRSPLRFQGMSLLILDTETERTSPRTWILGAALFVLLDVIIDPVALQGDRWFLGKIYGYRVDGFYFGIPVSNFAGWFLVGMVLIGVFQTLTRLMGKDGKSRLSPARVRAYSLLGPLLYWAVLLGNLGVAFWIGEPALGLAGAVLAGLLLAYTVARVRANLLRSSPC